MKTNVYVVKCESYEKADEKIKYLDIWHCCVYNEKYGIL
jgi:hypothetical protein